MKKAFAVVCFLSIHYSFAGVGRELVDRARQERLRRDSINVEVPLFTNEQLPELTNARVSVGMGNSQEIKGRAEQPRANEGPREVDKDESLRLLANRARSTREKLSAAVNLLHVLRLRHNHLRNLYLDASDEVQRMRLEAELRELLGKLRVAEAEEKEARQEWRLVYSQASKAGLQPEKEPANAVSIMDLSH